MHRRMGSRRGGAWAVYARGAPRRGPFHPGWATGPDYYDGDEVIDHVHGEDRPWNERATGHAMGSLLDVIDRFSTPGAVLVTAIVAGGLGLVVGVLVGESEMGKAVGRGVSGHVERGAHKAAGAAVRALLA
jgi:hypothetical protein